MHIFSKNKTFTSFSLSPHNLILINFVTFPTFLYFLNIAKKFNSLARKTRDLPDNLRLAALGAWRGRERGMAVFAGVFLASLVITTVLSYGVGLSQVFFEGSLEINVIDAKAEFKKAPGEGIDGLMEAILLESEVLDLKAISEILSKGVVLIQD